ncbi:hypothetical protein ACIBO5_27040 [Nonomuraea angiospora]|uniref:hypothetical protein n=1 Tax=Nonomuraea angiospora TaxID=46172 RepID=UPI00378B17C1
MNGSLIPALLINGTLWRQIGDRQGFRITFRTNSRSIWAVKLCQIPAAVTGWLNWPRLPVPVIEREFGIVPSGNDSTTHAGPG